MSKKYSVRFYQKGDEEEETLAQPENFAEHVKFSNPPQGYFVSIWLYRHNETY